MKKTVEPLIVVQDLSLAYGDTSVVRNANFTVNRGDIFVIMGMSGCGKSTIMRSMVGLLKPQCGHIFIDGTDMWRADIETRTKIVERFGVSLDYEKSDHYHQPRMWYRRQGNRQSTE